MMRPDREARLCRAKAIGRVAYRMVRAQRIQGYVDLDDGRKCRREYNCGSLRIDLYEAAHRTPHWSDFSQLSVKQAGRKVFVIRSNSGGAFKIVKFEGGDWESALCRSADYLALNA